MVLASTLLEYDLVLGILWAGTPGWAFAEIVLLWLAIAATLAAFLKRSGVAALLLLPYLGWVSFAAYLNFTIWQLNR